jgi:hypothetical protein
MTSEPTSPPLNADRVPIPAEAEHGDVSYDIADLGLPPELEAELRDQRA